MKPSVAVFTPDGLVLPHLPVSSVSPPRTIADALRLAQLSAVAQLYIHNLPPLADDTAGWDAQTLAGWTHAWPEMGGSAIDLIETGTERSGWPWHHCPDGHTLVQALALFATSVGMLPHRSPGATGIRLLKEPPNHHRRLTLEADALPPPAYEGLCEHNLNFLRPLRHEERGRRYLYAFDRNGQYLAACASLDLGLAGPVAVAPERADTLRPGYYRLPVFTHRTTTSALGTMHATAPERWVTQPTMVFAAQLGYPQTPLAVWQYRETHQPLQRWYQRLRDARIALMAGQTPPHRIALQALKRVYQQAIGWLAMRSDAHPGWAESGLWRPDWHDAIVATARVNFLRQLIPLLTPAVATETTLVGVYTDCAYLLSDLAAPEDAAEAAGLALGPGLRHWKLEGQWELGELLPVWDEPQPTIGQLRRKLRALENRDGC